MFSDASGLMSGSPIREARCVLVLLFLCEQSILMERATQIVNVGPSPSPLPSALTSTSGYLSTSTETPKIHMDSLSTLMRNLDSPLEFRVEGLGGGIVLYFLVGQLSEQNGGFEADDGYAGLIGVGVMTDADDD
jgi:hypothetical protein